MNVNPIPRGTHALRPHLVVRNVRAAVDFYKRVFLAHELMRFPSTGNGPIMHMELNISGCLVSLCEENLENGIRSPETLGGSPVALTLYCLDADLVFERALKAGAKTLVPLENMFWGDRYGKLKDPFGHEWALATHLVDLSPEEINERAKGAMQSSAKQRAGTRG